MKLSVVIPAHNEEDSIAETVSAVVDALTHEEIEHEVVVDDDASTDRTRAIVEDWRISVRRCVATHHTTLLGSALLCRPGLDVYHGDAGDRHG